MTSGQGRNVNADQRARLLDGYAASIAASRCDRADLPQPDYWAGDWEEEGQGGDSPDTCGVCGGVGYLGTYVDSVERCGVCETYDSDAQAICAWVNEDPRSRTAMLRNCFVATFKALRDEQKRRGDTLLDDTRRGDVILHPTDGFCYVVYFVQPRKNMDVIRLRDASLLTYSTHDNVPVVILRDPALTLFGALDNPAEAERLLAGVTEQS